MSIKLEWHTEQRRVKDLLPLKINPRSISDKKRRKLLNSLMDFGPVDLPAVNTDNKIVAGYRHVAILQLIGGGDELIDVDVPNRPLTNKEYKTYPLTSNRVHGEFDYDLLSEYFNIGMILTIKSTSTVNFEKLRDQMRKSATMISHPLKRVA